MLSQFTDVSTDPLDMALFAVGLRLLQLSKTGDSKFTQLLDNRNFTIQLGSQTEQVFRHYIINNGTFSQHSGEASEPTLTITFKDSMTGVKLLTKGDATAFMVGIQNGDVKMSGDYSLLMWFNQIAKFIVPKVPEKLQPVVEQAKPLIEKATPIAKDLFAKATSLFATVTETVNEKANQSKYFNEENTQHLKDVTAQKIDDIKHKAEEIKENLTEKAEEIKTEVEEKIAEVKEIAEEKLDEVKETVADVKEQAEEKLDEIKDKVADTKEQAEEKFDEVKETVEEKVADIKEQAEEKLDEVKETVNEKADEVEIIAENVETKAVNDDKSPITNITVTRHS